MAIKLVLGGCAINVVSGIARIRWRSWDGEKIAELISFVQLKGVWESCGEATDMWVQTSNCIREVAREVLGVSCGSVSRHKGDWWWSDLVRSKVEATKVAYLRYIDCCGDDDKAARLAEYKITRKEAKLEVSGTKNAAFERL
ncbi:unnamed protein product [Cuscuta campestris]|uniref:Uncharacterized protein n=1 Tax=Cuscuta campestris TaxID=132261 RepID=A0A484MSZ6_9ASTE|nr:unnamed protein product [Cuscuta campestris]